MLKKYLKILPIILLILSGCTKKDQAVTGTIFTYNINSREYKFVVNREDMYIAQIPSDKQPELVVEEGTVQPIAENVKKAKITTSALWCIDDIISFRNTTEYKLREKEQLNEAEIPSELNEALNEIDKLTVDTIVVYINTMQNISPVSINEYTETQNKFSDDLNIITSTFPGIKEDAYEIINYQKRQPNVELVKPVEGKAYIYYRNGRLDKKILSQSNKILSSKELLDHISISEKDEQGRYLIDIIELDIIDDFNYYVFADGDTDFEVCNFSASIKDNTITVSGDVVRSTNTLPQYYEDIIIVPVNKSVTKIENNMQEYSYEDYDAPVTYPPIKQTYKGKTGITDYECTFDDNKYKITVKYNYNEYSNILDKDIYNRIQDVRSNALTPEDKSAYRQKAIQYGIPEEDVDIDGWIGCMIYKFARNDEKDDDERTYYENAMTQLEELEAILTGNKQIKDNISEETFFIPNNTCLSVIGPVTHYGDRAMAEFYENENNIKAVIKIMKTDINNKKSYEEEECILTQKEYNIISRASSELPQNSDKDNNRDWVYILKTLKNEGISSVCYILLDQFYYGVFDIDTFKYAESEDSLSYIYAKVDEDTFSKEKNQVRYLITRAEFQDDGSFKLTPIKKTEFTSLDTWEQMYDFSPWEYDIGQEKEFEMNKEIIQMLMDNDFNRLVQKYGGTYPNIWND